MGRCLYCLGLNGPPSIEHVAPAALGELASAKLPLGAVCEPCNNWTGRTIDEAFVNLFGVRFIRGVYRIPDERGRRVERLDLVGDTRVEFPKEGPWLIKQISPEAEARGEYLDFNMWQDGPFETLPNGTIGAGPALHAILRLPLDAADANGVRPRGPVSIQMKSKRKPTASQCRRATRALMKMGLALVHHESGESAAMNPRYDPARAGILGQPYEGFFLLAKFGKHQSKLDLTVEISGKVPGVEEAACIRYGQFQMITAMRPGAIPEETREWAVANEWEVHAIEPHADGYPSLAMRRLADNWSELVEAQSGSDRDPTGGPSASL